MGTLPLANPKQSARSRSGAWYRYYAGYSPEFVRDALRIAGSESDVSHVLDPWVGVGTTCVIAAECGHAATGVDINPALVIIARAQLLRSDVAESLDALTEKILEGARRCPNAGPEDDPLIRWFAPSSARCLRALERSIFQLLVASSSDRSLIDVGLERASSLAAFFYVVLFRVVRSHLRGATSSNPTWVKAMVPPQKRARPSPDKLYETFRVAQRALTGSLRIRAKTTSHAEPTQEIVHGSSTSLNLSDESVDLIIGSPPYCTRIDYVASTRPELAVIGCGKADERVLRQMTLGSPTLPSGWRSDSCVPSQTAAEFLQHVRSHPTKASAGYYYRYFETYFEMLERSLREMHRVVRDKGLAFLVVQNSFYKNLLLDLPRVAAELATAHGWCLREQVHFPVERTMAAINRRARQHRNTFGAVETVLLIQRAVS